MLKKEKIAISISWDILQQIDAKIDKVNFKNRSHVIESLVREWLQLKNDIAWVILAHENNWDDWDYPLSIPKVLIKIDGKTLLEKHIELLLSVKITHCVVFYSDIQVKEYLEKRNYNITIEYILSDKTDGSYKLISDAKKISSANKLLVLLGDNYFYNFQLLDFIHYHNMGKQSISLVVKTIESSQGYWNIKLQWNNIVKFVEKPKTKEDISFIINTWIYIIQSDIIWDISKNQKLETDFFPQFTTWEKMKAYFHNGNWFHIQNNKTLHLFI